MNAIDTILTRRSIRHFTNDFISDEIINSSNRADSFGYPAEAQEPRTQYDSKRVQFFE